MILHLGGGGAEYQLSAIAPALARRGHDVHVAYVYAGTGGGEWNGCTLHPLGAAKYDPRFYAGVLLLLQRLRPDVAQTWLTHLDIAGGACARLLRLPWVMSERSAAPCYTANTMDRIRVALGRRADRIIANSAGGAEYWTSMGVAPSRIDVVPNFVPLADIDAAPPLDDPRIAAGDELLVSVGRLNPEKNLELLVDALQLVLPSRPHVKFAFCGDGPLRAPLAERVRAAGLGGQVLFPGFVPNVASWLKRASAAVAVSLYEGHPNAVLEAMAAGVPVIVSEIPAFRAILGDESAAFVPLGDAGRVAAAIAAALDDRPSALRRAARAREGIAALSLDAVVARYEEIYSRVAGGSR
jgi:glycosyltransferase involved in cell wall biosynthesis